MISVCQHRLTLARTHHVRWRVDDTSDKLVTQPRWPVLPHVVRVLDRRSVRFTQLILSSVRVHWFWEVEARHRAAMRLMFKLSDDQ